MIRFLRIAALALLALYLGVLATLFVGQRSLLYTGAGRHAPLAAEAAGLAGFEDVVLTTADGERLVAWWKPPEPGRAAIVYFHGKDGRLQNRRSRAEALSADGRGLLLVSYRGYSGSSGAPSEAGLRLDAQAAYDFVRAKIDPRRIVLYGESLGTGVAVRLATERAIGGLMLDAPYTSTAEVAAGQYWYVPVSFLMLDQFRSIDIIGQVKAPILIMHGTADRVVPYAFGERLFQAAPEPKRFASLPGVTHARVLEGGGLAEVRAFLSEVEAARPAQAQAQGALR